MQKDEIQAMIKDLTLLESLDNKSRKDDINKLTLKLSKLEIKIKSESKFVNDSSQQSNEAIVLFDKFIKKQQYLDNYKKYSKCGSASNNMPADMRLRRVFAFKVDKADEPFEYLIENKSASKVSTWLFVIVVWLVIASISGVAIYFSVKEVDNAYKSLRNYKDCAKYDFSSTSTSDFTGTTVTTEERYCFCRYNGWADVQADRDSQSSNSGISSFCSSWTDDYIYLYVITVVGSLVMYIITMFITYACKLCFTQDRLRLRKQSDSYKLISASVFVLTVGLVGVMPGAVFDSEFQNYNREWYLTAGNLY